MDVVESVPWTRGFGPRPHTTTRSLCRSPVPEGGTFVLSVSRTTVDLPDIPPVIPFTVSREKGWGTSQSLDEPSSAEPPVITQTKVRDRARPPCVPGRLLPRVLPPGRPTGRSRDWRVSKEQTLLCLPVGHCSCADRASQARVVGETKKRNLNTPRRRCGVLESQLRIRVP